MQKDGLSYHHKKKRKYCNWQDKFWKDVDKELSFFQQKVADCIMMLGDMSKKNKEDFKVQNGLNDYVVLGEELYVDIIRPFCVRQHYLPKQLPMPTEVQDIYFQEEKERFLFLQEPVVQKKDRRMLKKGSKGSGFKREEKMIREIFKQKLQHEIQMVANSHSSKRMQVDFGFKQKKVELKLITFFYVAYYIRKNQAKQKADEGQIFELISILIKVVRIFSRIQGPSFFDSSRKMQVSPTLILDLKSCIKGLKGYYYYSNKTLIIKHPMLIYSTKYNHFFTNFDIKPQDSQIEFMQAVKSAFNQRGNLNKPTLIFYRTMVGSDKAIISLALSQLVQQCKLLDGIKNANLQVLYISLNSSVKTQVGRYCYKKGQKFALAAMQRSIKGNNYYYPRIINCHACKEEKIVDLIISDPHCTYEMLDRHHISPEEVDIMKRESAYRKQKVHRGKLDRENIILFVDEPTTFCKNTELRAIRKLFDILANYPPKLTIFASATMPEAKELAKTIQLVKRKNPDLQVIEVNSKEFQIGCQVCSFKGEVFFPHTGVKDSIELKRIIDILKRNNFFLKLYTGPSLFLLLKKCEEFGLRNLPRIYDLPEIRQEDITQATFRILDILVNQRDDFIRKVCTLTKEDTIMEFKEDIKKDSDDEMFDFMEKDAKEEKEEEQQEDFVNFKRMLKSDAYKFLGGCLIGNSDPIAFAFHMFKRWISEIKPIRRLKQKYDKEVEDLKKRIRQLEDNSNIYQEKKAYKIYQLQYGSPPTLDFPQHKKLNTMEHYQRYCKSKKNSHWSTLIKPIPPEKILDLVEEVDDFIFKLLLCGVAIYSEKGLSPKYLRRVKQLAYSRSLAFIIADKSVCKSYNSTDFLSFESKLPICNFILTDDLIQKLSINQMFQLIGRAGQVGQSWSVRIFLQSYGLKKLNDYIHKPRNYVSHEGSILQQIAQEHLKYPLLRLRNFHCEVRFLDGVENSENIEIEINKKDAESHLIKGVTLVPFTVTKYDNHYLCKNNYQSCQYYQFPQTTLSYHDIPTLPNDGPINLTGFYNNFKDFIYEISNNAILRILSQDLQGQLPNYTILNHLKPKVYEPYYNHATGFLSILIHCQEEEGVQVGDYEFQTIIANPFGDIDNILLQRLGNLVDDAQRMSAIFLENPLNFNEEKIEKAIANYKDLSGSKIIIFFQEMVVKALPEAGSTYQRVADRVVDKQFLKRGKDVINLLAISQIKDVKNCRQDLFHICPSIREIWQTIEKCCVVQNQNQSPILLRRNKYY